MKRLVIYFHFDAQGVVDVPCRYTVAAMQQWGQLVFVTNGTLEPASRSWLAQNGIAVMERQNVGFDVGAYREALYHVGREELAKYEELVLMNYTLAGPVFPLETMFAVMDRRPELAFWGLTRHYAMRSRRFGGRVPEHLQSHFLAVRAQLFSKDIFWEYWRTMSLPRSYEESVICHETRFTAYFARQGFGWDSYVDTSDLAPIFVNPIMACPRELVQNRGCPFFKRRSFFTPYEDELRRTDGNAAGELQAYLRHNTAYPLDDLLRSLLRTQPLAVLAKNLHWLYPVPEAAGKKAVDDLAQRGLCLLHFAPLQADAVTQWYFQESAHWADAHLQQAVELFDRIPLLGVLSPQLPAWPKARQAAERAWRTESVRNAKTFAVPVGRETPPAPCAGWALVRKAAFQQGIPKPDVWRLPLEAQQNGYASAYFTSEEQLAGESVQLASYMHAATQPAMLTKQLARLLKHTLKH